MKKLLLFVSIAIITSTITFNIISAKKPAHTSTKQELFDRYYDSSEVNLIKQALYLKLGKLDLQEYYGNRAQVFLDSMNKYGYHETAKN